MTQDKQQIDSCIVGASGGIGYALTELLLTEGRSLVVTARNKALPALLQLQQEYDNRLQVIDMDIANQDSVERAFEHIRSLVSKLELLINCSGLLHIDEQLKPEKRLEDVTAENMLTSYAVNSIGPLLIARYALPLLKHEGRSVLANISARVGSISDNRIGGWYAYRASKAAQNMITRNISIEYGRRSPNTICVGLHPGTVDTPLSRPFQKNVPSGQLLTPVESARHLHEVVQNLKQEDSGKVFAWDGSEIDP